MGPDHAELTGHSQEKYEHIWMRGYIESSRESNLSRWRPPILFVQRVHFDEKNT